MTCSVPQVGSPMHHHQAMSPAPGSSVMSPATPGHYQMGMDPGTPGGPGSQQQVGWQATS